MKSFLIFSFFFAAFICAPAGASAQVFTNEADVANGGYDVVAYFTQNEALRGGVDNKATYGKATYYFSSAENKAQFEASPTKYLPRYGGYCAFAMAMKNAKVPSDPTTFKIHDGNLYLFFNDYYEGRPFNTLIPWNQSEKELIAKADANWAAQPGK